MPIDPTTGEILQTGRIWGVWKALPTGEFIEMTMSHETFTELTRRLRRWGHDSHYLSRLTAKWAAFLVLADSDVLLRLLRGLPVSIGVV